MTTSTIVTTIATMAPANGSTMASTAATSTHRARSQYQHGRRVRYRHPIPSAQKSRDPGSTRLGKRAPDQECGCDWFGDEV